MINAVLGVYNYFNAFILVQVPKSINSMQCNDHFHGNIFTKHFNYILECNVKYFSIVPN